MLQMCQLFKECEKENEDILFLIGVCVILEVLVWVVFPSTKIFKLAQIQIHFAQCTQSTHADCGWPKTTVNLDNKIIVQCWIATDNPSTLTVWCKTSHQNKHMLEKNSLYLRKRPLCRLYLHEVTALNPIILP